MVSCPSLCCSGRKKMRLMQRSRGFGCGVFFSKICYSTVIVLSVVLPYVTAANQWTIVEIELFPTVGRKRGCQPFSCSCLKNVTHSRKEIYGTCLSKESIPAINLGIPSIRSLPESWGSWERQYVPAALLHSCIMPMSSLQLKENTCLMQRSREIGHRVVVSKICYSAVIVPSVVLFDCCTTMNNSRDWAFCNSGLEVWLPAFQLPMFVRLRNPFPPFLFGIPSVHSLPEQVPESGSALCIMVASCPSLCCSGRKKMRLMQRSRGFGRGVFFSKICYSTVIVLSVVLCDCCKPMSTCRDWAFSNSGLEVWLSAFQLPMFAKCDSLPKRDLWDIFV